MTEGPLMKGSSDLLISLVSQFAGRQAVILGGAETFMRFSQPTNLHNELTAVQFETAPAASALPASS